MSIFAFQKHRPHLSSTPQNFTFDPISSSSKKAFRIAYECISVGKATTEGLSFEWIQIAVILNDSKKASMIPV